VLHACLPEAHSDCGVDKFGAPALRMGLTGSKRTDKVDPGPVVPVRFSTHLNNFFLIFGGV
jgi:hypothetical protein